MMPEGFVPAAERHGLIGLVDREMLAQGVRLAAAGRHAEINLSAQSICDEDLARALERLLAESGEAAERIVFEVTESDAIRHLDAAEEFADRMVRLGCSFALDDFGTGYGSLTYLRRLPVQFLKIDSTFVHDLATSRADQAMVRSIVAIAREFGLRTVAEGVEDGLALSLLRDYGVHNVQGYLMGRPRPLTLDEPRRLSRLDLEGRPSGPRLTTRVGPIAASSPQDSWMWPQSAREGRVDSIASRIAREPRWRPRLSSTCP